jgi:segregation and condensation protein A
MNTTTENTEQNNRASVIVLGETLTEMPKDLYIPPDALKVFLETFQGPLDLLLYLIKKQNINILDIPIVEITRQYIQYVDLMQTLELELAAEYLLMAATLAEIKSRILLPRVKTDDEESGEDPRAELIARLQEYERYRVAAENLAELPREERDIFIAEALPPEMNCQQSQPDVSLEELLKAFKLVMERVQLYSKHQVEREVLSIRERMSIILNVITSDNFTEFTSLFTIEEGRMGAVVTLIAILELIRQSVIELVQNQAFGMIYIRSKGERCCRARLRGHDRIFSICLL